MENLSNEDQDYNLSLLLDKVKRGIFRVREKELSQWGITPEQSEVLYVIDRLGEKATTAEMSRLMLREHHTVSGIVSRMQKKGLVRKVKDSSRKNLIRINVTEKGQDVYRLARERKPIHEIFSSITKGERDQLESYLRILFNKMLDELERYTKPPFYRSPTSPTDRRSF